MKLKTMSGVRMMAESTAPATKTEQESVATVDWNRMSASLRDLEFAVRESRRCADEVVAEGPPARHGGPMYGLHDWLAEELLIREELGEWKITKSE